MEIFRFILFNILVQELQSHHFKISIFECYILVPLKLQHSGRHFRSNLFRLRSSNNSKNCRKFKGKSITIRWNAEKNWA